MKDGKEVEPILTQRKLAEIVGITPESLSTAKNKAGYIGRDTYQKIANIMGVDRELLQYGSRVKVAAKFREFFRQQRMMR